MARCGGARSGVARCGGDLRHDPARRAQLEGISLTVSDKLRIAAQLDHLGVAFIEGGWPGANPKDDEFFARARAELRLENSELVAFGSTRRVRGRVDSDPTLANLAAADTSTVCIVGKCWDYHVTQALRTTLDEAVRMVADSVGYLVAMGRRVLFDAEHFFDGYSCNPEFSLRVVEAAAMAGADTIVLCDTNGGALPHDIPRAVRAVATHVDCTVGVHLHNDTGCGVASALAAVCAGATHVQGTINGYGERVGNCDLVPIIANLELKMGVRALPEGRLRRLAAVSHHVAELVNLPIDPQQPYVGPSAFAPQGGAARQCPQSPSRCLRARVTGAGGQFHQGAGVGDGRPLHVGDESRRLGLGDRWPGARRGGRHTQAFGARRIPLRSGGCVIGVVDAGGGGLGAGFLPSRIVPSVDEPPVGHRGAAWNDVSVDVETEATVALWVGGERCVAVGEGNGPVHALDTALRAALGDRYPGLEDITLTDYKVRVLDTQKGTAAVTRVLLDSTDHRRVWTTIGVSRTSSNRRGKRCRTRGIRFVAR